MYLLGTTTVSLKTLLNQSKSILEMRQALAILLLLAYNSSGSVIFEDCGSSYELEAVSIEGCQLRLPCFLTLGEAPEVVVEFTADFPSKYLDQDVIITLNFVNQKTEVTPEPCASTGCPVSTSSTTSFTSRMFVPNSMAINQRGYLRWRVYNEAQRLVLCYVVLVQTQSPLQKQLRHILGDERINTTAQEYISLDLG